jgi:radical SAM superfamily enzyme YgiQ (UPF0313 family)
MNILLISPLLFKVYGRLRQHIQPNMGLAYLGAMLRKHGYSVTIIDMHAERLSLKDLASIIKVSFFDIAGITVTTPTFNSSLEIAKVIKDASVKTKVVLGGMHPSVTPIETIFCHDIDFVVRGEGEFSLLELVEALEKDRDLRGIDGIVYKDGNGIIENRKRDVISDLDILPFPARDLFKNKSYTYPGALYSATAPIITSRGCPGRCAFCNAHSIFGRRFRPRSVKNVVDEIELLKRNFMVREIHIWDDNFITQEERVYKICDEILRRNLKLKFAFPNGVRADFLNEPIMRALKRMGTYSIAIGVESGNQEMLNKAKKDIRLERIIKTFELARKFRFETWAFFMFGLPGEDKKTAYETINFAKRIDPDIAKFHIFKPYPGSELYKYIVERNLLTNINLDNYGIHTPPVHRLENLSEEELTRLQKNAYRKFYLRPEKFFKQLLHIKSVHRLKSNLMYAWEILGLIFSKYLRHRFQRTP